MQKRRNKKSKGRDWAIIALVTVAVAWIANKRGQNALETRTRTRLASRAGTSHKARS